MERQRFKNEQAIGLLREQEAGDSVTDLWRNHGASSPTVCTSKARYGGLGVSATRRLNALEDESGRLKRMLADAMIDNSAQEDLLGKKNWLCAQPQFDQPGALA